MENIRKISIGLAACVCSVAILLLLAALLTPVLIEKTALGGRVRSGVSALIGGEFDYTGVNLAVFPLPHLVLTNPQIRIPHQMSAFAKRIEVQPEIMALLTGRISFTKAAVIAPQVSLWVSDAADNQTSAQNHTNIKEILSGFLATVARKPMEVLPVDQGIITQGSVSLIYGNKGTVTVVNIDAVIRNIADTRSVEVTAASNLFERLSVKGAIDIHRHTGSASVKLGGVKLNSVLHTFFPAVSVQIEKGEADIGLDLRLENQEKMSGKFTCTAPDIRFGQAGQTADIEGGKISGNIHLDPSSATIAIAELVLGRPSMRVSGSVGVSVDHPTLDLHLQGRSIDINATRSVLMAMAGADSTVQTIVEILQGGEIPLLTVSAQADSLAGLASLDNLVLQGSLHRGEIVVPGANLVLTDLSGDVDIAQGMLTGKNVLARWQTSTVKNANFKITLVKDPLPLELEAAINVDAADIPALLRHLLNDQKVNDELDLLQGLQGGAAGFVSLTGDADRLNADISATDIGLSARHPKLPFPLTITGGKGSYNGEKIQWERLNGSLGTSSFTSLSGNIALDSVKSVAITSGTSHIVIADLQPWFASNTITRRIAGYYGGGKGILQLSGIEAEGSLQEPDKIHFHLTGQINDLTIQHLPRQPGPLTIASLQFKADRNTANFTNGRLSMLDGFLTGSGRFHNYLGGNNKDISANFAGKAGPQLMGWVAEHADLPPWLKLRPLSVGKSYLTYSHHKKHQVSAKLRLQDGLEVDAEVSIGKNSVAVDSLRVQDDYSRASLTATGSEQSVNVSFDGTLHDSTVDQLVQTTPPIRGSIAGKARISFNSAEPIAGSLTGEINGKDLTVPLTVDAPLRIKNIALSGETGIMTVKSADLSWDDTEFFLAGTIRPNIGGPMKVDLDVEADTIDADAIMHDRGSHDASPGKETVLGIFPLPVAGSARLRTNKFKAGGRIFAPLQADIRMQQESVDITVKEMGLCGVAILGAVHASPQNFSFHLEPEAHDQQINSAVSCFGDHHFKADGRFNLAGAFAGHGAVKDLARSTTGRLEVKITDGRLYRDFILLNILKFLNVTQVLTGSVSAGNMLQEGVGFKLLQADIELHEGELEYKSFVLDANELKLSGTGTVDIPSKQINFTVLVALQSTLNTFLGYIPLIGGLLQSIPTIPLGLSGTIDNVYVLPLTPSSIGLKLRNTMTQIFDVPLKIINLDEYLGGAHRDAR